VVAVAALVSAGAAGGAPAPAERPDPQVGIFFYAWYGTPRADGAWLHWGQGGNEPPRTIGSNFYPSRGPYSSGASAVLRAQMREIAATGVDTVIVSWWGPGSIEDSRLRAVAAAAHAAGLHLALHVEPWTGRTPASVVAALRGLSGLDVRDVYVYDSTSSFGRMCQSAHQLGLLCAPSVGPGFDSRRATGDQRVRERNGGRWYDHMWQAAVRASPDLVTITSYNEWHEGTQIEPARAAGGRYRSYEGAWGLRGQQAERAYLDRTAYWVDRLRGVADVPLGARARAQ
jgi:hypothetical protein